MNMRAFHRTRSDDSGMSIVEVVVASSILFFVLTAVLGLIGATTKTSIHARQRTVMTNAVASYLDYARGLPFDTVELSSVDASGALESVVTTTSEGFTVTLTTTVQEGSHETKEITINAVCTAAGYPTMTTSAFAAIRDRSRGMTMAQAAGGPTIRFGTLTPAQEAVLVHRDVDGAGALYIDADAQAEDGVITTLEFMADGQRLRDRHISLPNEAYWTPGLATVYQSIRWDTLQVVGQTTTPAIQDGWRIVRVEAIDDQGRHAYKERRFLVDNFAPAAPGEPRAMTTGWKDTTVLLNWTPAQDGTEPAYRYVLLVSREETSGGGSWSDWTTVDNPTLTLPAHTLVSTAFSRYYAWVKAVSPRGLASDWVGSPAAFYSRPLLAGTGQCTISGSNAVSSVYLNCTSANFPVSVIQYDLYRGTSVAGLAPYKSNITLPYSETSTIKKNELQAYYFQIRATFTPSGLQGGTAVTISSDAVGPMPVANSGVVTLATVW